MRLTIALCLFVALIAVVAGAREYIHRACTGGRGILKKAEILLELRVHFMP